jgi:hypothetical protein
MAPLAVQKTTLQEHGGANTGPVVNAEALDVEDASRHAVQAQL